MNLISPADDSRGAIPIPRNSRSRPGDLRLLVPAHRAEKSQAQDTELSLPGSCTSCHAPLSLHSEPVRRRATEHMGNAVLMSLAGNLVAKGPGEQCVD